MKNIKKFEEFITENTSATGGPSVGGMGAVVSAQPSGLAGQTIGTNWASGGGTEGSGDIGVPYNPSGSNRVFQKIPIMGKNHGSRTGKKSREKKLDLKALKAAMVRNKDVDSKPRKQRILNFNDFLRNDLTTVKK